MWERLRDFARAWSDPASPLANAVTNAWLEFDLEDEPEGTPVPSVFFGTKQLVGEADTSSGVADPYGWMLDHALPLLRGAPLDPALRAATTRALEALPKGAYVFQVGVMLSRPGDAVRLCIRGLENVGAYLGAAGWQSRGSDLPAWAAALARDAQHVALDIDVDERGVRERIGLECSFDITPEGLERQAAFVSRLAAEGDCTAEKAQALGEWTRLLHSGRGEWPEDLRARAAEFPTRTVSALWCWLYHVKVVEGGGRPREAKAYLAVQQDWLDGQRVREILQARQMMAITSALSRAFPDGAGQGSGDPPSRTTSPIQNPSQDRIP